MSKFLVALVTTVVFGCTAPSSHLSLGSAQGPLALSPDCCEECTVVCSDPVCGECVVTLRCDGDTCTVVSCVPLAPGETATPAH